MNETIHVRESSSQSGPLTGRALAYVVARLIVGAVFLTAGWFKAADFQDFSKSLWLDYQLPRVAVQAGFFLPAVEIALGLALVLGWHVRAAARSAAGMLAAFSAAIVFGMLRGNVEHCDCFGRVADFGPIAALIRNGVLAAVAIWLGWRMPEAAILRPVVKRWIVVVATVCAGMLTGTSAHKPMRDRTTTAVGEAFPADVLLEQGVDVRQGRWVVFGFSASCGTCWDATHQIETLTGSDRVSVVGVTVSGDDEIATWRKELDPGFPVVQVDPIAFDGMQRDLPTTWLLEDGLVIDKREKGAFAAPMLYRRFDRTAAAGAP